MRTDSPAGDLAGAVRGTVAGTATDHVGLTVARSGGEGLVLGLLDEAVTWLNRRGITEQWGTEPFSTRPERVAAARSWVESGGCVMAVLDDRPVGALVVGDAPSYVPPSDVPELYLVLLVGSREPGTPRVGRQLIDVAEEVGRRLGVDRLRVDCYAGGDRALVGFYESAGFSPTVPFEVGGWPGQVLERPILAS